MPRDERAYLADIIDSCKAIEAAIGDLDLAAYQTNRLVRSAVEREFYHYRRSTVCTFPSSSAVVPCDKQCAADH